MCDHIWVKLFVSLMYSCTDLKICKFCLSVKVTSSKSRISIDNFIMVGLQNQNEISFPFPSVKDIINTLFSLGGGGGGGGGG